MTEPVQAKVKKQANKRGAARLGAVQAIYQMDVAATPMNDVIAEFETYRLGHIVDEHEYLAADEGHFRRLVKGVVDEQKIIDPLIHNTLAKDWPLKRLDLLLRSILRVGVFELKVQKDATARVIINEYMDIAKAFYDQEEPKIVNGVLDRLARELRPKDFTSQ
jgi:N utilization substance protein B